MRRCRSREVRFGRYGQAALWVTLLLLVPRVSETQASLRGTLVGVVSADNGSLLPDARVTIRGRSDSAMTVTDARGEFVLSTLDAGTYALTVRQLGYQPAELAAVRVIAGDTVRVRVVLTRASTQLSTVVVVRTPTSIDALSPESPRRFDRELALQLPTSRDAASVIALVPGALSGRLWGGAGAVTNNFQIDGVSMNHAGVGGDFLQLPRDWVEAIEVRGVGASAEFGNFQGGVINAITRTGTNHVRGTLRSFHEDEALTSSNFERGEIGAELAQRTEFSSELAGPIISDRLFYFIGAQFMERSLRSPALFSSTDAFLASRERQRDARAVGKLTWRRAAGERADLLVGASRQSITNAGLNGLDAVESLQRVDAPVLWYEGAWRRELTPRTTLELTLAGYSARESRTGNGGADVPAVRVIRVGNQPAYQNSEFDERRDPTSHSAIAVARHTQRALGAEHAIAAGVEFNTSTWRNEGIRTGGMTWRPYLFESVPFVANDVSTWNTTGSDWGGNTRLNTRMQSLAAFVQDDITIGERITLSPGLRVSEWTGWMTPCDASRPQTPCTSAFKAVRATAFDPRIGVSWDVTGRNTLAVKAHWGRFHQGMTALLFDRVSGANAYSNRRFYNTAPPLTDARTTFTESERDAQVGTGGFAAFFNTDVLDETGVVDGYRQPYVDQLSIALEKTMGEHWKVELVGIERRNGNVVGLLDRNAATNYTALSNIKVDQRFVFNAVLDPSGIPLVLNQLYVSNRDLVEAIRALNRGPRPGGPLCFDGWCPSDIASLLYDPGIVLTTLRDARRHYRQLTSTVTAHYARWRGEGSLTLARLVGNVDGITGHGVISNSSIPNSVSNPEFTAGPFVRPNERINFDGRLPNATEFEGKLWLTGQLPKGISAGVFFTHIIGEPTTPTFTILGRYAYRDAAGTQAPRELLPDVLGQQLFVETRGSRTYASRSLLDLHVERALPFEFASRAIVSLDVFNALGSRALIRVKTEIDDQALADPSSVLGAARQRVMPRSLRLGVRIE